MAATISGGRATPASIYAVRARDDGATGPISVSLFSTIGGPSPSAADNPDPEIILLLDWSQMAGTLPFGGHTRSGGEVAAAVAAKFTDASFLPALDGHALAELPIHLIGHSRGGSLVNSLARELAKKGIWVDQLTTLDPHPVDGLNGDIFDWGDAPMGVPRNVIFADDYWRSDADPFDFDGEPVAGAHNVALSEAVLDNGGYAYGHSDVHLWYHGTIPPYPTSDGGASVGNNWYGPPHPAKDAAGFRYSHIVGGARPADGLWPAYGGSGSRAAVTTVGTQWPNIDRPSFRNSASETIPIGEQISLSYSFEDDDGGATITWFTDSDRNPFNGHLQQLPDSQTLDSTPSATPGLYHGTTTGIAPGTVLLYARIADNDAQVRCAYLPTPVTFTVPLAISNPRFVFDTSPPRVTVQFSQDVSSSLAAGDLLVQTLPSGAAFNPSTVSFDTASNTATFAFSGTLADGNYTAKLAAGSVSGGGASLESDFSFDFFVFAGDANRDRTVGFADLVILAQNYGASGKTFPQGDFDYNGAVGFPDLVILAQRYGTSLPVPSDSVSSEELLFRSDSSPIKSAPVLTKQPTPKKSFGTRRIA
jgi:hypothetical protein